MEHWADRAYFIVKGMGQVDCIMCSHSHQNIEHYPKVLSWLRESPTRRELWERCPVQNPRSRYNQYLCLVVAWFQFVMGCPWLNIMDDIKNIKRRRRKMRFIPILVSLIYWLWNTKCCANARNFFTSPRLHFWISCNATKNTVMSCRQRFP